MNDKERRFCEEYLVDLNASAAALRAGYSQATAYHSAAGWIHPEHPSKPKLRKEIDRLMAEQSKRTGINADRILRELANIAFSDISTVVKANGCLDKTAPRADLSAVAAYKVSSAEDSYTSEIRMHDKNRALELLGKHLGLFTENLRVEDVRPVIIDDAGGAEEEVQP